MPFIIREHPTHLTPINGVAFAVHEAGSISEEVTDQLAEFFLEVPLYRLAEDDELPEGVKPTPAPVVTPPVKETAAQKKIREKAEREKAAQEKAEQEAAEKAALEAANTPPEGDTTEQTDGDGGEQTGDEQTDGEKPEGGAATTQTTPETGVNGDGTTADDKPAEDNVF